MFACSHSFPFAKGEEGQKSQGVEAGLSGGKEKGRVG
jgi:hypothetical protein